MWTQRMEGWRSATLAILMTALTVTAVGQDERISNRNTDFSDVNRMMQDGSFSGSRRHLEHQLPAIDYSRIDKRQLQNLLAESLTQSDDLYKLLTTDYRRYPEVRSLLTALRSIRSSANQVSRDLQDNMPMTRVHGQLRQLDSDWQVFSHRVKRAWHISAASKDKTERIDRLQASLEKLFQMEPQLDRRALLVQMSQLTSQLYHIVQELELDPTGGDRLYQLIHDVRKLNQEANRVQDMILDQYAYSSIANEYQRFKAQWSNVTPRLRQLNNRYVERSLRTVHLSDTRIHNLLRLEHKTSRAQLKILSQALTRDVDEFFNRVPLKLLLRFKDVVQILETSDAFYGAVQNLEDCIDRDEDDQTLLNCYQYVEEYGVVFVRKFASLRSQAGRVVLKEIEDDIVSLRNELHLAGSSNIDTAAMVPLAASLENLADHLNDDVTAWLASDRQSFRSQALQASSRFVARSRGMYDLLSRRPTDQQLRAEVDDLIEDWRNIYQYLGRCNTSQREHLRILSQDISRTIYRLRAPLQI